MTELRELTQEYNDMRDRAERAEAELAEYKQSAMMLAVERGEFRIRAERAESELARLHGVISKELEYMRKSSPYRHGCCTGATRDAADEIDAAMKGANT